MKTIFKIFRLLVISPREWLVSTPLMAYFTWLNYLIIDKYADIFMHTQKTSDFYDHFRVSGFDALIYSTMTQWHLAFFVHRHPLLADLLWPLTQLNSLLYSWTGLNMAPVIMAVLLMLMTLYSFVFIRRTMHEVIGMKNIDATLLSYLTFSFGYLTLTYIVPDHFAPSMTLLTLTMYLAGKKMQVGKSFTILQTVVLFLLTAGVTMSNGVKTLLMALFTNGKRFFRPAYLVLGVIVPVAAIWAFAQWQQNTYILPREQQKAAKRRAQSAAELRAFTKAVADTTTTLYDSASIALEARRRYQHYLWEVHERNMKDPWNAHKGKPISKDGFGAWTDMTTPRWDSMVDNLFGETIQLHEDYLLQDTLRSRPVFISYRSWINYMVEAIIVLLFVIGIWMGRRNRFLWMCLSCMAFDLALYLGLGFGLNEVYIMAAHWAFIVPVVIGFIFHHHQKGLRHLCLRLLATLLTLWLWIWNGWLIVSYLTQ